MSKYHTQNVKTIVLSTTISYPLQSRSSRKCFKEGAFTQCAVIRKTYAVFWPKYFRGTSAEMQFIWTKSWQLHCPNQIRATW